MKKITAIKEKKVIDLKPVKSVMFVRLGKLGDMMVASWILKKTREQYPHLRIGLLTLPRSAPLFKYNTDIDTLKLWRPATALFLAVRERLRGWDLLVDLNDEPSRRSVLAKKLLAPGSALAFDNGKSREAFDKTVKTLVKDKSHVLERLSVMAGALGLETKNPGLKPAVYLKPGSLEEIKNNISAAAGKRAKTICLNISAGHSSRYWQEEKWVGLGRAILNSDKKVFIIVLSSPDDSKQAERITAAIGGRTAPAEKRSFNDFLAVIAASDMVVSPDTSAVHAACAFDVPVLGLYPEPYWNFVSWRPANTNCAAIRARGEGVASIPQDEVIKEALKMIKKIKYV